MLRFNFLNLMTKAMTIQHLEYFEIWINIFEYKIHQIFNKSVSDDIFNNFIYNDNKFLIFKLQNSKMDQNFQ